MPLSIALQDLHVELQSLRDSISAQQGLGASEDAAVLSLVANSLQRLHAAHMGNDGGAVEEDEEEEEEEEEVWG